MIPVASDVQWNATIQQGEEGHFTLTVSETGILVEAKENLSTMEKQASVTLEAGNKTAQVNVVQAPSSEAFSILPENTSYEIGNDGGSLTIAVRYGEGWSVDSDSDWCLPLADADGRTFTVTVDKNGDGASREAIVSIVSESGAALSEISVRQSSEVSMEYDSLIGEWEIWSDRWFTGLGTETVGELGEGSYATLSLNRGGSSNTLQMEDFFMDYTVLEVYYDPQERTVAIPLGVWCTPDAEFYDILNTENYLAIYNIEENTEIKGGYLYGKLSEDGTEITLTGIDEGFGLGMCYRSYDGLRYYSDLYYTASSNVTLKKTN